MAGIITISKGHDASYPWKQIGTAELGMGRTADWGTGYYLAPAERGGEPPGIWTGKGVVELGLRRGGVVDREVFEPVYGQHLDPRDPSGEALLGRAPRRFRSAEEIYAAMLAAEPQATAERRAQLVVEAKAQVRTPDLYWDATFSVSKSISLFHASALANAAAAAERDELAAVAAWEEVAEGIWDAIMEGNAAALEYLQREAGQTRAGYHPGGRWEDAREWVVASFRQHTSRDGDPQLHVHNLILHKVCRESDGQWRALDSMSLYRHRPAASAIATLVMENALTRRFAVRWVPRRDGHGREIADVSQALMDMFSSRRQSIGPLAARLAGEYEAQFGRAPDARALTSLRQWANHATRRGKDEEPLDLAALVRRWAAQARVSEAGALEPLAPAVIREPRPAPGDALEPPVSPEDAPGVVLSELGAQCVMREAVAAVQAAQPTWTEADLIRHLGERLPAEVGAMSAADAARLLRELARRALATEAVVLSAPEWPRVPDCLRRACGESVYVPHGASRYATRAQLVLEDRLLADAQEMGVPRLDPATAARLLGADQARLEAQLQTHNTDLGAVTEPTGSGLRLDQAAAAFCVLTSPRRAEVMAGPAGSGKTLTVAAMARVWRAAGMGEAIGLTTSQTAANVLTEAGITRAYNTARFLGHREGRREAQGPLPVDPGSLLILDEASMMSLADVAAILALARERGCKVVVTGDHEQLAAVEGGGAMMLLARRQGWVQLAEPQRFAHAWEREATLRLRAGDVTVLADYQEHGRLRGGTPDEAAEQAYRGWLADYLDGTDTLLMARTEDQARELSRRARDDLIRYGLVAPGPGICLAGTEQASAGDLIMARRNTRTLQAGEDDRELTNRDVLQILTTGGPGDRVQVRRLLDRSGGSGRNRWSAPFWLPRRYLARHCTLGYATTQHAAQGRTVDTAHVLVDGLGDRQGLYVAMSRGRDANHAYCITHYPRLADTREGSRPAPELDRLRRLDHEHAGLLPIQPSAGDGPLPELDPVTILAGVLARDGGELSATETLERELSRADHLGVLGGIWDDLVRRNQHARFEQALRSVLPSDLARGAVDDPACTWLWRSLREAELAGLDGGDVLREAVESRSMTGTRDVARVLDSRVRRRLVGVLPQPPGRWADQVPDTGSAEMYRYLRELADTMDDRICRLGEHAAQTRPLWARQAFGPVPDDLAGRAEWEHRASVVAAYRERYGYAHTGDPIGPEPAKTSPEARAAWHAALNALGRLSGIDLRGCTDSDLWLRRSTYERETAWAPSHVAEELRLMRQAERDAHINAVRAEHEHHAAHDPQIAMRHQHLARLWLALEAKAAREAEMFATATESRRQWEAVTQTTRRIAIAADLELRRRHPGQPIPPLRPHPAEREGIADAATNEATWIQLTLDGTAHPLPIGSSQPQPSARASDRQPTEADGQLILGLTPDTAHHAIPKHVLRIRDNAKIAQAKLEDLASLPASAIDVDELSPGLAWPAAQQRDRDAVLQPAQPEVVPATRIVEQHHAVMAKGPQSDPERG
jgi:conjugative relaxase-like TrwC/TraI family protein